MEKLIKKVKILCWNFSLFGGEGAESGVEELYSSLKEMISDNRKNKELYQHEIASHLSIIIYDYLEVKEYVNWQSSIKKHYANCFKKNILPIFIGGNHLSVLPIYNYYTETNTKTLIISFDAHVDAYDYDKNKTKMNHGNFLFHFKKNNNVDLIHIGNRELSLKRSAVDGIINNIFSMQYIIDHGVDRLIEEICEISKQYDEIHLDIDVDVFDQSIIGATGVPMPFGLYPQQMIKILSGIWSEKIVGLSITEFNSIINDNNKSKPFLMWFIEYLILLIYRNDINKKDSVFF